MTITAAAPARAAAPVLFEGARVIVDPRQGAMEDGALLIQDGKVIRAGKKGSLKIPADARRVDVSGKTIIPALIDTHIHIGYQKDASYSAANYARDNLEDQLARYAYAGVAAVMTLGTDPGDLPQIERAYEERKGLTLLLFAGRGIAAPNAGPGDPALKPAAWAVSTPDQARNAVREEVAKKVDFIKIWVDDRGGTVKKTPPEIYRAVIDEAHRQRTRVIAHVYYLDDAKDLLRAGVDGFAHLVRDKEIDDETVALMKERSVYVMPNLGIAANRAEAKAPAWLDDPLYRETTPAAILARVRASFENRPPQSVEAAQKIYTIMQANLKKLNAAGVKIVLGGDSGAVPDHFHAATSHLELQRMVEAGMTPVQALTAATVTAAEFLRLRDHGTLEPGKSADFLVLNGDPLQDITNTRRISMVYLRGAPLKREAMRSEWR